MIVQFQILILLLSGLAACNGYRILAVFPHNGRSHFNVLGEVAKALAQRGHQVDVLSNYKLQEPFPNYTDLEFPTSEFEARFDVNNVTDEFDWLFECEKRICNLLGDPKISTLIKNPPRDPPYDAVLVHMLTGYQCFSAVGYVWDVPVIAVATTGLYAGTNFIGNPFNLAISSGLADFYKQNLTFWERVCNAALTYSFLWENKYWRMKQEPFLKKYYGPDIPSHRELEKNVALIFTNSHYSFYGPKPRTPALIEIGGINIKNDTSKIDPDLKQLLDNSNDGFIYFSFGTLVNLGALPSGALEKFFSVFRKISPVKVIMRAADPDIMPKNLSDNVSVFKWLPQQKLFQHPNIKAFVYHGGGLSSQETIHYAVPVICVPLFAEQEMNCDIFSSKNMGVRLDINTAEQIDYDNAFQKVLSNNQYKEAMKKFSLLYWDRPLSPHETVNYWVEYVIRHGKNVLKSSAVNLEWWQFELLDVHFFLFTCISVATVLSILIIGCTFKLIIRLSRPLITMKSKKKSN